MSDTGTDRTDDNGKFVTTYDLWAFVLAQDTFKAFLSEQENGSWKCGPTPAEGLLGRH